MRAIDEIQDEVVPHRVLVCLRLVAERNLVVVGQESQGKPQPQALIFNFIKKGTDTYTGLLESERSAHALPLDLAINLVHFETALRLPPERFTQDTRWITADEGKSFWEYLYFVDIVEDERNVLLLPLSNRKTFTQMSIEDALSFVGRGERGHFLRLKHSHWFSAQNMQKAA
ncbi:MAG TPA: hypothetical protein VHL10_00390 [Nitrososphaera sp.]|jgi:hypothetical protein|nr:hypothetical protein [Nitrososphaera sp.]